MLTLAAFVCVGYLTVGVCLTILVYRLAKPDWSLKHFVVSSLFWPYYFSDGTMER